MPDVDDEVDTEASEKMDLESLFPDGEIDEKQLKDHAQDVRRTLRKTTHFSRQARPLKESMTHVYKSIEKLQELASFSKGLEEGDWSTFANEPETVESCIKPFLSFYRSYGKLPDVELDEALAFILYMGVVEGLLALGTDLEMSRDTPRGSYP